MIGIVRVKVKGLGQDQEFMIQSRYCNLSQKSNY